MHSRHIYSLLLSFYVASQTSSAYEISRGLRNLRHSSSPVEKDAESYEPDAYVTSSSDVDIDTNADIDVDAETTQNPSTEPSASPMISPTEDTNSEPQPVDPAADELDSLTDIEMGGDSNENKDEEPQGNLSFMAIPAGLFALFVAGLVVKEKLRKTGGKGSRNDDDDDRSVEYDQAVREEGYQDLEE